MTYGIYGTIDSGIPTPLARDVFGLSFLNAQHSICAQFEINYHRCLEAFGHHLGMRYCDLEYRDFLECTNNTKKVYSPLLEKRHRFFVSISKFFHKILFLRKSEKKKFAMNEWSNFWTVNAIVRSWLGTRIRTTVDRIITIRIAFFKN